MVFENFCASLNAECLTRIAGEFKTSERRRDIHTLSNGQYLETSAEHFRMKERLECALPLCSDIVPQIRPFGNDSSKEMMLIGEPGQA